MNEGKIKIEIMDLPEVQACIEDLVDENMQLRAELARFKECDGPFHTTYTWAECACRWYYVSPDRSVEAAIAAWKIHVDREDSEDGDE